MADDAEEPRLDALRAILTSAHELASRLAGDPQVERVLRVFGKIPEPDRETILAMSHLREATSNWVELERDPGALYRGARLEMMLDKLDLQHAELPEPEREFLDASKELRDREVREEEDRIERQARDNRRLRWQRRPGTASPRQRWLHRQRLSSRRWPRPRRW